VVEVGSHYRHKLGQHNDPEAENHSAAQQQKGAATREKSDNDSCCNKEVHTSTIGIFQSLSSKKLDLMLWLLQRQNV
jgi:hypothetical protein